MSNLSALREELLLVNEEILSAIRKRQELVKQISSLKNNAHLFDVNREKSIFESMTAQFKNMSVEDVFLFSYLMEIQVRKFGDYPAWSHSVHLNAASETLWSKINPVMLKIIFPKEFSQLTLNAEFKKLLANIL